MKFENISSAPLAEDVWIRTQAVTLSDGSKAYNLIISKDGDMIVVETTAQGAIEAGDMAATIRRAFECITNGNVVAV